MQLAPRQKLSRRDLKRKSRDRHSKVDSITQIRGGDKPAQAGDDRDSESSYVRDGESEEEEGSRKRASCPVGMSWAELLLENATITVAWRESDGDGRSRLTGPFWKMRRRDEGT